MISSILKTRWKDIEFFRSRSKDSHLEPEMDIDKSKLFRLLDSKTYSVFS